MAACHHLISKTTAVPLEVKAGSEPGSFEGYGAIFGNLDRDGDIVARGAFAHSLQGRMPALLWQHNTKEPIGRFDSVTEDAKGLYVKGRLSMEGRGREAYDLLKMGALDGLSIGFVTQEASRNAHTGTRTITKANLMEISLVTFPANDLARISSVKSEGGSPETPRDFERFLRESGFSRSRAKAITAKGFVGSVASREDDAAIAALVNYIELKRIDLEQKGWLAPLARWVLEVLASTAVSEGVKAALRRLLPAIESPRDRARTPMPIKLFAGGGRSASFLLRTRLDTSKIDYEVFVAGDRTHKHLFECMISYTEWKQSGPTTQHMVLSNLKGRSPSFRGTAEVGGVSALKACLEQASKDSLEEYRRGLESGRYQPRGTITYHGHILGDHEDFDAPKSASFIIRDRGRTD